MSRVWVLVGWFGDQEWIEGVYAFKVDADREVQRLWETRDSEKTPEWCKRLAKFGTEPYELL